MSGEDQGKYKTPNDPVKEQISQDKYKKGYDELSAHERIVVGGTKGGITTKEGAYAGHYEGEGTQTDVAHTGEAAREQGGGGES